MIALGRALIVVALCGALAGRAGADKLTPEDLAKKQEGGYVTGLPLVGYSTDLGFGGGARLYYYWNGRRSDPRFPVTPYLHRIFLQGFATTRGVQFHWLDYDAPKLFRSPYRARGQLIFGRNINANYFGLGQRAMAPLQFPGAPGTYDSFADYDADQRLATGGVAYTKYDQYDVLRPLFLASVERDFLRGRVRVLAGLGLSYARIRDYTGTEVDAVDSDGAATRATMAETRLHADCAAGRVVGCDGGRDNFLRFGVSYDTRDYEPDPNRGVFADLALDVGTVAVGSEFGYVRLLAAARGYWSPAPRRADLVLAGRVALQYQSDGTPFSSMNVLPFTEDPRNGLGGHRTLRGFKQDRFVGPVMAFANAEVRWTFARTRLFGQRFAFIAAPFVDVGRVFDRLGALTASDWRPSYGGAMRVSWNLATIVTADYGRSAEDSGFYLNFGHIF